MLRRLRIAAILTLVVFALARGADGITITTRRSSDRRAAAGHHDVGFRCATSEDLGEIAR